MPPPAAGAGAPPPRPSGLAAVWTPLRPPSARPLGAGSVGQRVRRELPRRAPNPRERPFAYGGSRLIQRRRGPAAIAGVVFLGVLALPVVGMRLGFPDDGNFPKDTSTRQAYDLL